MAKESIVDASVPSAGRIYDYLLGGHHNFEVDRLTAQQILAISPFALKAVRMQRWCLQDIADELTVERGYDTIIDFASGLPTQDHIHLVVPKGVTVIYSDYDPVVVEYARKILGDTPNVYFFEADARRPEELLNRPEVVSILGAKRRLALVYWGVAGFISDEDLSHVSRTLYEWADSGSCWVLNAQGAGGDPNHPAMRRAVEIYKSMGTPMFVRSLKRYVELVHPWLPDHNGFVSLLDWHGLDLSEMSQQDLQSMGEAGAGYGVYLNRQGSHSD